MIVPANRGHAIAICYAGIRTADIDEWVGGTGGPVLPALLAALQVPGSKCEAYLKHGLPLCLWGTQPTPYPGLGQVWLIASVEAERHVIEIHRHFQPVIEDMQERFPVLLAYTHPRNTLHHRWMEHNGFEPCAGIVTRCGIPYRAYTRRA